MTFAENHSRCGAKTRTGGPCQASPEPGKRRCRVHGGAPGVGAPEGPRNGRWRGGRYSRTLTPEQRRAVWRAQLAERRARIGADDLPGALSPDDLPGLRTIDELLGSRTT